MIKLQGKFNGRHWEKKGIRITYNQVIKNMYDRATTNVRNQGVVTKDFSIKINLHQGSSQSP